MSVSDAAIFIPDGNMFVPTELAGSPWGEQVLHGGPPAGLMARAIERCGYDPAFQVARLTVDLFRPVPRAPLLVDVRTVRQGRRIIVAEASLFAADIEVSRATVLLLRRSSVELEAAYLPPAATLPGPEGIPTTGLSTMFGMNAGGGSDMPGIRGFHTTIEVRRIAGRPGGGGGTAWIRIPVPFVAGEPTSPLVRVAATADFGNALGHIRASHNLGFINTDISLYLHRMPAGEWICLESHGMAEPHGLGMVETVVHDADGSCGRVVQALLANPRNQNNHANGAQPAAAERDASTGRAAI